MKRASSLACVLHVSSGLVTDLAAGRDIIRRLPRLHVVIPFYDEVDTLEPCVRKVLAAPLPAGWSVAVYLIDDHSGAAGRAASDALFAQLRKEQRMAWIDHHAENRGKGAAVQTGFDAVLASSEVRDDDVVIIQDADLEYDPRDYAALLQPIIDGHADAVIGTRWGSHHETRGFKRRIHAVGNRVLTATSNLVTGYRVGDMECCYKLMPVRVLRRLRPRLTERRFGIEPQIVAGLARLGARVVEVPVHYDPRGIAAGKKIGWVDGLRALHVIMREPFRRNRPT